MEEDAYYQIYALKGSLTINDERSMNLAAYHRSAVGRRNKFVRGLRGQARRICINPKPKITGYIYCKIE
jgi:hypothetical protein